MNYTLNQLRIFVTVLELGSITKAAAKLNLTQPAVSIQLKNLQEQFEFPLFEVVGKKVFVTDFGNDVVQSAVAIFQEIEIIENKVNAYKGLLIGRLRISVVSTGKYIAPYFLTDFLKLHSGVELSMVVTNKAKVLESLQNNEVDFSLVNVLPESIDVGKIALMTNKLFLVGPYDKKFRGRSYTKALFNELPLIYREEGSGTRQVMEKYIKKNKLPVRMKFELTSNEAVKQALIAGLGHSIIPLIGIKNEIENKQLQIINVSGFPITSTWHLVWRKDKKLSNVAKNYLQYLQSEKNSIIEKSFNWIEMY
jgi:LysR family transcriptional regulator, low CO2-responsive transcriptional regulator